MVVSGRILVRFAVAVVVLLVFAVAGSGGKKHSFLWDAANVSWSVGIIGLVLLIVLGVVALIQSRRTPAH